jgi:hypothetical protein
MLVKKYWILYSICIIICSCNNHAFPQKKGIIEFFGSWKVVNRIVFNQTEVSELEKTELASNLKKCISTDIVIDTNGISAKDNYCEFENCNYSINEIVVEKLKIINDEELYELKKHPGQEIIYKKVVGKTFMKMLDKSYSLDSLEILNTKCKITGSENELRICIISNVKIGLFSGEDLLILERRKK